MKKGSQINNGSPIFQTNSDENANENHWRIVHAESKFYYIELSHNGLTFDMPNGQSKQGTQPIVWQKHPQGSYNQQFFFSPIDNSQQSAIIRRYYP